jgi:hypothetical protein
MHVIVCDRNGSSGRRPDPRAPGQHPGDLRPRGLSPTRPASPGRPAALAHGRQLGGFASGSATRALQARPRHARHGIRPENLSRRRHDRGRVTPSRWQGGQIVRQTSRPSRGGGRGQESVALGGAVAGRPPGARGRHPGTPGGGPWCPTTRCVAALTRQAQPTGPNGGAGAWGYVGPISGAARVYTGRGPFSR